MFLKEQENKMLNAAALRDRCNFNRRNCKDIVAGSPTKIKVFMLIRLIMGIHVAANRVKPLPT
jgi:hypothetical protein